MFSPAVLLLSLFAGWGLFGSVLGSAAVDEAYGDVVVVVSPGQQLLTGESLRSLFNTLEKRVQCGEVSCEKCNLTGAVYQLINNQSTHGDDQAGANQKPVIISASQFTTFSAGCILYLLSPDLVCTAIGQGTWGEEAERFLNKITHQDHEHIDVHDLEALIQELRDHYEPTRGERCITIGEIMTEVNASTTDQTQEVGAVLGRVLYHVLQGHCFITESLPEESFFLDYIMERLGSENFTVEDLEAFMRTLNLGLDLEDSEHEHDHKVDGRADPDHPRARNIHNYHERNTTWDQRCFSAEELVLIYRLDDNSSSGLDRSDMARLSPAFIQQTLSGACTNVTETLKADGLTTAERYIYATIANVVITLMAMFGIVLLLCTSCTSMFQLCVQFCISLAVGSLTGDALLHLLPMVLGLHTDEGGSHNHSNSHQPEIPDYVYKILVVLAGIYYFYLMEAIFSLIAFRNTHHHDQHGHSEESEPHHCDHGRVLEMYQQERKQKDKSQSTSKVDLVGFNDNEKSLSELKKRTRQQRLLPYMITIGDGIHNFADGLAMGAAFSLSWRSGLATSLAVLCHELPHELGDFAILLHSGVPVRRALLLNVGSAMTSFIGLYIALNVATDIATQQWIGAITAGLFLYVGLADMLPTMVHISSNRPWLTFLLQNVGLLTGWGILLVLSLYEERISF
ncbi:Zinc transporter ZIP4 Solute carrier family 39 member 4 Zrt- and Irt-like protein 4 [Channa argus]|uniref:Zinc transporter ZIP4 n=1 Tax=Channa argus TaxID=215402 RepID=A0A6G1QXF1_CHAAH|nr:Zinc transporter ZIP4 Solute carrier family 39 member 4 Zrt- and Irt-like protein 4 [Channa argus]KAK2921009.1 hypothetical protein Q8A73_000494 [Channa argus]